MSIYIVKNTRNEIVAEYSNSRLAEICAEDLTQSTYDRYTVVKLQEELSDVDFPARDVTSH